MYLIFYAQLILLMNYHVFHTKFEEHLLVDICVHDDLTTCYAYTIAFSDLTNST